MRVREMFITSENSRNMIVHRVTSVAIDIRAMLREYENEPFRLHKKRIMAIFQERTTR